MIEELEHENRLIRARNERLEQERNHVMGQYRELLIQQGNLIRECNDFQTIAARQARTMLERDEAVRKLHAARGRYHTQLALCDLMELHGLPCERPVKKEKVKWTKSSA